MTQDDDHEQPLARPDAGTGGGALPGDENPYQPPEAPAAPSRSELIQRPERMPGTVIVATVLIGLLLVNFVASAVLSSGGTSITGTSTDSGASVRTSWVPTLVTAAVLTGILMQHPAGWSVARSLSVVGLLIGLFGLGCGAASGDGWVFLGIAVTVLPLAVVNVAIFLLLGRPVSRAWFGLGCPSCGLLYPYSAKFGYTLARCRECHTVWEPRTGNLKAS